MKRTDRQKRTITSASIAFSFFSLLVACGGNGTASISSASPPAAAVPSGGAPPSGGPAPGSTTTVCSANSANVLWGGLPGYRNGENPHFVATSPMTSARATHTATLMQNGKVLLMDGGQLDIDDLLVSIASAEIFDPASQTFHPAGAPCTSREFHTATLLATGKVLITGGRQFDHYATWLLPVSNAELYDPDSNSFSQTGAMAVPRTNHTSSLLADGRVLIVGGDLTGSIAAEIYDPTVGTFSVVQGSAPTRFGHTATVLASGKVLIAGGDDGQGSAATATVTAEIYDPGTNSFTAIGAMSTARSGHTATRLPDGKVLIVGGKSSAVAPGQITGVDRAPQTAELFDPDTASFTPVGSLATARISHAAILRPDGKVAIFGGFKSWTGPGDPLSGGQNYIGFESYDSVELFDPATKLFTSIDPMPFGRFWHSATLLPDGSVLLAGGIGGGTTLTSAELYR